MKNEQAQAIPDQNLSRMEGFGGNFVKYPMIFLQVPTNCMLKHLIMIWLTASIYYFSITKTGIVINCRYDNAAIYKDLTRYGYSTQL